jgi:fructan beta-fructosidase
MTIPRELLLRETTAGLRMVQRPVRELRQLRGHGQVFKNGTVSQANQWIRKAAIMGDSLEINLDLEPGRTGQCGARLLKGDEQNTTVGFDEVSHRVFVDRSNSGNNSFHKAFSGIHAAPAQTQDGHLQFHIFVDACSIECFAGDGETVFSELVFPAPNARQLELFARASEAMVHSLEVWPLKSSFKWRE